MHIRVFIFFLCIIGFIPVSYSQTFKAGAAVRIITPDPLLPVSGGIGTPKPATTKQGDLYARALVLEKDPPGLRLLILIIWVGLRC